jgi:hypothetical protein
MTDREKAIVMAYTGVCMLTGDKLSVFYEYVEGIMGRPVYTHEMGTKVVDDLITEKARPDFIALCADESSSEKPNKWIPVSERLPEDKQSVLVWCPQYKNIYCAYLEKEQWWIFGAFVQMVPNAVVAWMPLPEPYKASPIGGEKET